MQESQIANNGGDGKVDPQKLQNAVANWGKMSPAEQQQVIRDLTRNLSPRHREGITNYLEGLSRKLKVQP